jgi:aldose 1-epimerase
MRIKNILTMAIIFMMSLIISCQKAKEEKSNMKKEVFGTTADGKTVNIYTLKNSKGMEVKITNFGGIVVSISVPDKNGKFDDVVLGFDSLKSYENIHPYFGAIIGRYGNRIGNAKFTLEGTDYTLPKNDNENTLHGGLKGFDKAVWNAEEGKNGNSLILTYTSKDGEEGFPGNLNAKVIYTITDSNELKIEYSATTDKTTVINLTNHSYFNLAGAGNGDILSHEIMIDANRFTPIDKGFIPTGEYKNVGGTPFNFSQPTEIGAKIDQKDDQLIFGKGYDHNFVLNKTDNSLTLCARVSEPTSGRVLEVYTTEPGVQFYTGNFLDGTNIGKSGKKYNHRYGFCLETQHFPDSPNKPEFPSTKLKPGDTYRSSTVYKFSVK